MTASATSASAINAVRRSFQKAGLTRSQAKSQASLCDRARIAQLAAIAAFDLEYPEGYPEA